MTQPAEFYYHNTKEVNYKGMPMVIPSVINYIVIEQDGSIYGFTHEPEPDPEGFFYCADPGNLMFPLGHFNTTISNWDTSLEAV